MVPSLILIFLVLGTIFMGLATPTEGRRDGCRRRAPARRLQPPADLAILSVQWPGMETNHAKLTAFVVFILLGARTFSLVVPGRGGKEWVEHLLTVAAGRRHAAS